MPYEVIKAVTVPKSLGELTDDAGNFVRYENEGHSYKPGDIIPDEDIAPDVLERLQDGDEHLAKFLTPVDEDEASSSGSASQASSGETADERREAAKVEPKLEDQTVEELQEKAAELDVSGRSGMNKNDLVKAIKKAQKGN